MPDGFQRPQGKKKKDPPADPSPNIISYHRWEEYHTQAGHRKHYSYLPQIEAVTIHIKAERLTKTRYKTRQMRHEFTK